VLVAVASDPPAYAVGLYGAGIQARSVSDCVGPRPLQARSVSDGINAWFDVTPCVAPDPPAYAGGLYGANHDAAGEVFTARGEAFTG
jgi:hypothetical protein